VQTPMGYAGDRYGPRHVLMFGLVLAGVAYLAIGLTPGF